MEELDDIVTLLRRYLSGKLTKSEREQLEKWTAKHPANKALLESFSDEKHLFAGYTNYLGMYDEAVSNRLRQIEDALMESITSSSTKRSYPNKRLFRWLPYVAALSIGIATATWFLFDVDNESSEEHEIVDLQQTDIPPGGNRATLTLTDGRTITLDEARYGIVIGRGEITYNDGNPLTDVEGNEDGQADAPVLELSTPKGGTYQITLPDGTQVWLNAASTLKYPLHFSGVERMVELAGEAYFSVVKDTKRPFKVVSAGQEVQVLGTEFNVSAYPDEGETKTTLVAGTVRVAPIADHALSVVIQPGQQSILRGTIIDVQTIDIQQYTAWKDGLFYFKQTPFDDMIRQVARWYDIEVTYRRNVPEETFTGKMQRELTLMTVLGLLNISDAKIQLEGQTLIIQ